MNKIFEVLTRIISLKTNFDKYSVGQIWEHKDNSNEDDFRLYIVQIDEHEKAENIYHLYVEIINPHMENEVLEVLHHIPVDKVTLEQSLIKLVGTTKNLPDISEGYNIWKEAEGGVYSIPVSEIIQISEEALEKSNTNEENINSQWPDTADGDVFRSIEASGFDFSIEHEIDFNVDFDSWPPPQEALDIIFELHPDAKINEPDSEHDGDVSFIITALLEYEMVIRVQNEVTTAVAPYGGVCESWGVRQG